ncbi:helix-turn-helix domain-containing protein [Bradyrhizobium erythrophlei]|uniref:helix-turn-helix domain-containing protein n=1 Tax=Bradyrhizobium erythrophlei TaxID=1437360 RepID=UPI0035E4DE75
MLTKHRKRIPAGPVKTDEDEESIFARSSFYAEFAPREEQAAVVDSIYILKDRGRLTGSRMSFASPLRELAFIFRKDAPGGKVVFNGPSLDHRRKARAFFGWIVGVKLKPTCPGEPSVADAAIVACRDALEHIIQEGASCSDILDLVDRTLFALSLQTGQVSIAGDAPLEPSQGRVSDLAVRVGSSVRTLQRRVRIWTGCPPKRFLAAQRFRRSLYEIAAGGEGLSAIASDLGFSDQAHLTREFRRHAGVTPGAFRRAWCRPRAQAVRFLQDAGRSTRLMMAVWPLGTTTEAG